MTATTLENPPTTRRQPMGVWQAQNASSKESALTSMPFNLTNVCKIYGELYTANLSGLTLPILKTPGFDFLGQRLTQSGYIQYNNPKFEALTRTILAKINEKPELDGLERLIINNFKPQETQDFIKNLLPNITPPNGKRFDLTIYVSNKAVNPLSSYATHVDNVVTHILMPYNNASAKTQYIPANKREKFLTIFKRLYNIFYPDSELPNDDGLIFCLKHLYMNYQLKQNIDFILNSMFTQGNMHLTEPEKSFLEECLSELPISNEIPLLFAGSQMALCLSNKPMETSMPIATVHPLIHRTPPYEESTSTESDTKKRLLFSLLIDLVDLV